MSAHAQTVSQFVPDDDNTRLLRDAFGRFATGVAIVTTAAEGQVVAITANSFSSVSLTPPLALWSASKSARRFRYFETAEDYAIHILSSDQSGLCWDVAKNAFALGDGDVSRNADGVPLLDHCLARFECRKKTMYDGGDHVIMLGQVLRAEMRDEGEALAFYKGQMGRFTAD